LIDLAAALGVVAAFAMLGLLQKPFKLSADNSFLWVVPCIFAGIATYNLIRPHGTSE
jgi:hypothetical protein